MEKDGHEKHLKDVLGKLTGANINISPKKNSIESKKRKSFCIAINILFSIRNRDLELFEDYGISLEQHSNPFYDIINSLFDYSFNKSQMALIQWWIYDRLNEDGTQTFLIDKNTNQQIQITSSELLYEYVKELKDA